MRARLLAALHAAREWLAWYLPGARTRRRLMAAETAIRAEHARVSHILQLMAEATGPPAAERHLHLVRTHGA